MAACGLIMSGNSNNNCSPTSDPPMDPHASSPSTSSGFASHHHNHRHPHSVVSAAGNNGRPLKKRTASEMDDQMLPTANDVDNNNHFRFLRWNVTFADTVVDGIDAGDGDVFGNHVMDHSQTTTTAAANILNHSTTSANIMAMTSLLQPGILSPAPALSVPFPDSLPLPPLPQQPLQSPSVCLLSGLPLFPPEKSRQAAAEFPPPLPSTPSPLNPIVEGAGGSFTMDEVDNIIKDLIQSSASVSIPQLIQTVWEVVQPCNPNLAAVLEHRLRFLNEQPLNPPDMRLLVGEPYAASVLQPPRHQFVQQDFHQPSPNFATAAFTGPSKRSTRETSVSSSLPQDSSPSREPEQQGKSSPSSETPTPALAPSPAVLAAAAREKKEEMMKRKKDEEGLHLLTLLLQCAEAVSADNLDEANKMLLEISERSTPYGTSAQRVAAYFSEAISARLINSCLGIYSPLPSAPLAHKISAAFQVFNGLSPFVKFSHFTANQAIQEAFEREDRVHIIDLDIMQGLQWPGLFHILATRPGGPPHVRVTGLGTSKEALQATGKRLRDFADKLGLPFEYVGVAEKVGNLDPDRLGVSKREAVAVHWFQHSLYDVTGSDTKTLWLLQRLAPKVVTVVEQDLSHAGSFLGRFVDAIHYYSALFDSLGASYCEESEERHVVEQQLLSREIRNISDLGPGALAVSLPFSCVLGLISSLIASSMVSRNYIWGYACFQFVSVILFSHIFYSMLNVNAILSIILASFTGFGIAISTNSLIIEYVKWRLCRQTRPPNPTPTQGTRVQQGSENLQEEATQV
ncbi:hypothetical protein MLD38_021549 [Melastoma candidum]|uniref:Uncharacterized protein n=1 Tax=Melastoma candidum TaxID=119954 RepID=A0ACB9QFV2_9MYRT|nr:hypothetical protein MLD38_021549 [Melastoma candidum]